MKVVVLGLSITSSWGNGHATTFRGLIREFTKRGHDVLFLERDVPWYASHRDLPNPPFCETALYESLEDLKERFSGDVREADFVLVGSYVPEGVEVGQWAIETARGPVGFYDIDTPVTLAKLERCDYEYLHPRLISKYDIYMSFTGGPTLQRLEKEYGSPMARPLYCSFDPSLYYPEEREPRWDMAYMGTYSDDRQPTVNELLVKPAASWPVGRFCVAGPQYPASLYWPSNVQRIEHLPPSEHREFYNSQFFTLNVTRDDMIRAGYSPSVRLFEAAACAVPIISDYWDGLDSFFSLGSEILVAQNAGESLDIMQTLNERKRRRIGLAARERVMREHTAEKRAEEFEGYIKEAMTASRRRVSLL